MSMRDIACSGYVVKASELTKVLPEKFQEDYEKFIKKGDSESIDDLLSNLLPSGFPSLESVFVWNADTMNESDGDFEEGDVLVTFAETDLFTKTKSPAMVAMEKVNINPQLTHWTVWG